MTELARLKRRIDFLALAATRRKHVTPGLILQACPNPAGGMPRVGFTASRKVGIAVKRNRARRRLRATADQVLRRHASAGHDYVLIARGETLVRPFADLLGDLETAMKRLNAWAE
jgi:ribonuclease P protein component